MSKVHAQGNNYYESIKNQLAYYAELDDQPFGSFWFGSGAERLQLSGPVNCTVMGKLMYGYAPDGTRLASRVSFKGRDTVYGFDETDSVPKGVTQVYVACRATRRKQIVLAVVTASNRVGQLTDDELLVTRRGHGGQGTVKAEGVEACFLDLVARDGSPQLHIHRVRCNVSATGGALDQRPLWFTKIPRGQLFRAELDHQLRRLGIETFKEENGVGFGVKGVPAALSAFHSNRSREIEAAVEILAKGKRLSRRQRTILKSHAALATRTNKRPEKLNVLLARWREDQQSFGFSETKAAGLFDRPQKLNRQADFERAYVRAIKRLEEKLKAFTELHVSGMVAEEGLGCGLSCSFIRENVSQKLTQYQQVGMTPWGTATYKTDRMIRSQQLVGERQNRSLTIRDNALGKVIRRAQRDGLRVLTVSTTAKRRQEIVDRIGQRKWFQAPKPVLAYTTRRLFSRFHERESASHVLKQLVRAGRGKRTYRKRFEFNKRDLLIVDSDCVKDPRLADLLRAAKKKNAAIAYVDRVTVPMGIAKGV